MRREFNFLILFVLLFINIFINPLNVYAVEDPYILLDSAIADVSRVAGLNNMLGGTSVSVNNELGDIISFLFVLLVTASLSASVFMIMAGSFKRFTTDSVYKKTEGNEMIRRAVYGLLAVLSMYLIILTINPDMLRKGLFLDNYKISGADSATGFTVVYDENTSSSGWPKQGSADYQANVDKFNANLSPSKEATARELLSAVQSGRSAGGISINNSGCSSYLKVGCTNVSGFPNKTFDFIYQLKKDCDKHFNITSCTIEITGGTEWWLHAYPGTSHIPGKSTFDLHFADEDRFTIFVRNDNLFTKSTSPKQYCNSEYQYTYEGKKYSFCDEKGSPKHWHVYQIN